MTGPELPLDVSCWTCHDTGEYVPLGAVEAVPCWNCADERPAGVRDALVELWGALVDSGADAAQIRVWVLPYGLQVRPGHISSLLETARAMRGNR